MLPQARTSLDSLFEEQAAAETYSTKAAQVTPPPIPGLHFFPDLRLPQGTCDQLADYVEKTFFTSSQNNQIMLFGAPDPAGSGLPPYLEMLLLELSEMLYPHLPLDIHRTIFEPRKAPPDAMVQRPRARQVILNRYAPGQGITPHVDLLGRFDDGILGVSLDSGCVMDFERVDRKYEDAPIVEQDSFSLYLPVGSLLVLTGDARYKWTHGITAREEDLVLDAEGKTTILFPRATRTSLTFRWLLPEAHIVGDGQAE